MESHSYPTWTDFDPPRVTGQIWSVSLKKKKKRRSFSDFERSKYFSAVGDKNRPLRLGSTRPPRRRQHINPIFSGILYMHVGNWILIAIFFFFYRCSTKSNATIVVAVPTNWPRFCRPIFLSPLQFLLVCWVAWLLDDYSIHVGLYRGFNSWHKNTPGCQSHSKHAFPIKSGEREGIARRLPCYS